MARTARLRTVTIVHGIPHRFESGKSQKQWGCGEIGPKTSLRAEAAWRTQVRVESSAYHPLQQHFVKGILAFGLLSDWIWLLRFGVDMGFLNNFFTSTRKWSFMEIYLDFNWCEEKTVFGFSICWSRFFPSWRIQELSSKKKTLKVQENLRRENVVFLNLNHHSLDTKEAVSLIIDCSRYNALVGCFLGQEWWIFSCTKSLRNISLLTAKVWPRLIVVRIWDFLSQFSY